MSSSPHLQDRAGLALAGAAEGQAKRLAAAVTAIGRMSGPQLAAAVGAASRGGGEEQVRSWAWPRPPILCDQALACQCAR